VPDLFRVLRDVSDMTSDEVTLIANLYGANGGKFELSIQACHVGDSTSSAAAFSALRGSPLLVEDAAKPMRYIELISRVPDTLPPVYDESRAGFLPKIDEQVVSMFTQALANAPPRYNVTFVRLSGAVTRVPATATAFPLRTKGFAIGVSSSWKAPDKGSQSREWIAAVGERLSQLSSGAYVNVMDIEPDASVRAAYGQNYRRLSALKAVYDPGNLFSINQNIKPVSQQ
jgi:hypothetical protein